MIVALSCQATGEEITSILGKIHAQGYKTRLIHGEMKNIVHVIGVTDRERLISSMESLPGVEQLIPIIQPFKLASRECHPENSIIKINETCIGGREIAIIAGPCAVESEASFIETAHLLKKAGVKFLRAGVFKPGTSPYTFQGLGEKGLETLTAVREETGLLIVTEVLSEVDVPLLSHYVDIFQVGSRNMHNIALLKTLGRFNKPVLLKRGFSATIEDWLMSAEYILSEGNPGVILCERGIRTFEKYTAYTLDLSSIPVIHQLSHLPVIVDPSHASGSWRYVEALSKAAVAADADGLLIVVHPDPANAVSHGTQSLKLDKFLDMMKNVRKIAEKMGRSL